MPRPVAYAAAAWAVLFALPHLFWSVNFAGIRTSLTDASVRAAPVALHVACLGIAVFLLIAAAVALLTRRSWPARRAPAARRLLLVLTTFGAVVLLARAAMVWIEFSWLLSHPDSVPAGQRVEIRHLGAWFLLLWGPWFGLGGVLWAALALSVRRSGRGLTRPSVPAGRA